jgi:hypothetical protein
MTEIAAGGVGQRVEQTPRRGGSAGGGRRLGGAAQAQLDEQAVGDARLTSDWPVGFTRPFLPDALGPADELFLPLSNRFVIQMCVHRQS